MDVYLVRKSLGLVCDAFIRRNADTDDPEEGNWTTVYNGSEPHWPIDELREKSSYTFRVRALNTVGWSPYSENSTDIIFSPWMQGWCTLAACKNISLFILLCSVKCPYVSGLIF